MFKQRIQVRFTKQGDLRFISHQDLMRLFERALRRTGLPLRMSEGFNPRPCISFPLALAVAITGRQEVMEFELDRWVPVAQAEGSLRRQLAAGITLKQVLPGNPHHKAQVEEIGYQVRLPAGSGLTSAAVGVLLEKEHLVVSRQRKGREKQVDIRPSILELSIRGGTLYMRLAVTEAGTTRPEEVLALLGLDPSELPVPLRMARSLVKLKEPALSNMPVRGKGMGR